MRLPKPSAERPCFSMIFINVLRVLIGWHFLYEGFVKLITPGWTSAYYLLDSKWPLSGFFHWIAQTYPKPGDYSNIQMAVDHGAAGAFVHGGIADAFVRDGDLDTLQGAVDKIKSSGIIGGAASHSLAVPQTCMKEGIAVDFFMKTFHHDRYWSAHPMQNRDELAAIGENHRDHDQYHDNVWCTDARAVIDFFNGIEVPMIGYKVLAAGAIHPKDGLKYVFENGADFACVDMFDFQVIENANIAIDLLTNLQTRERPWMA